MIAVSYVFVKPIAVASYRICAPEEKIFAR